MKKNLAVLSIVSLLSLTLSMVTPSVASASPARPRHGTRCFVQDANLVQYEVDCEFHEVRKLDENGNEVILMYQDKAQMPPEAALPTKMFRSIFHVDCGCLYDGDYMQTLTPSGRYESHGPINHNQP